PAPPVAGGHGRDGSLVAVQRRIPDWTEQGRPSGRTERAAALRRRETLSLGAEVHGTLVSVAAAAVAVAAGSLIGMPAGWTALIAASVLLSGAMRLIGGAWIAAGALVIALAASDPSPWRTATVIAAVHLLQVLGSLMLVVPLRSRVALRGLAPTAVRFAIVQAFCQAFGLLAWLLPTRSG